MRNPCLWSVVGSLGLVACGGGGSTAPDAAVDAAPDAKVFMDAPAPVYDFSCMSDPAPTTAPATIDISGNVQQVSGSPLSPSVANGADVDVDICVGLCAGGDKKDSTTSATNGNYAFTAVDTDSMPLDGYLLATKTGLRDTYVYPPAPLVETPPTVPIIAFSSTFFSGFATSGTGMIIVGLVDCANTPITDTASVDLSVKQGGTEVSGTTEVDASMFASELAGAFIIINVPPDNATTIGALYGSQEMRAHVVRVVANSTTETLLRPGY